MAAGLDSLITPHMLRHAYATHSREPIEALKELMATVPSKPLRYRHATVERATNRLDDLLAAAPGRCRYP